MTEDRELVRILMMTTLGESILVETLKSAASFITRSHNGVSKKGYYSRNTFKEAMQCYYFVQGTGLDILIESYELDYNAEEIRKGFNYQIRRKHESD